MAREQFENNYSTQLNGAIDSDDTTIVVDDAPSMTGEFRIKIDDEIILVKTVSGSSLLSCTRGVEGTSAASHSDDAVVTSPLTAGALNAHTNLLPTIYQYRQQTGGDVSQQNGSITITSAAVGQRLVMVVGLIGRPTTGVSCTNVTWTKIASSAYLTAEYVEVWVGVVSGGASGTTVSITTGSSNWMGANLIEISDQLTPTLAGSAVTSANAWNTTNLCAAGPVTAAKGTFFVGASSIGGGGPNQSMQVNVPYDFVNQQGWVCSMIWGYGTGGRLEMHTPTGSGANWCSVLAVIT